MSSSTNPNIPLLVQNDLISVSERVVNFTKMIDSMETLSSKKKELWKEIYTNALIDRNHALICYNNLQDKALANSTEHAIHAPNIAKYIASMSKSNDQLIRLAELIAEAETAETSIDSEEIYNALEEK